MSHIDELLARLAPDGVPFVPLRDLTEPVESVRWDTAESPLEYIDLTSVDRATSRVMGTTTVTAATAPSRARQLVHAGDLLFGTTRPMLKRFCEVPSHLDGQVASTGFCVLRPREGVSPRWLFHHLSTPDFYAHVEAKESGASYPAISDSAVKAYRVPVPPREVQAEIVRILDSFQELEAELEAELDARRAQYAHYRSRLFSGTGFDHPRAPLSSVGTWLGGATPSKDAGGYWLDGSIPWIAPMDMASDTVTQTRKYVTESAVAETGLRRVPGPSVAIVVRSNILRRRLPTAYVPMEVTLNQDMRAVVPHPEVDARYLAFAVAHYAEDIRARAVRTVGSMAAVESRALLSFEVPMPPIEEQRHIASTLDSFDALVNDLSSGLPAEIAARRQQYEHYRDRLLTFEEAR